MKKCKHKSTHIFVVADYKLISATLILYFQNRIWCQIQKIEKFQCVHFYFEWADFPYPLTIHQSFPFLTPEQVTMASLPQLSLRNPFPFTFSRVTTSAHSRGNSPLLLLFSWPSRAKDPWLGIRLLLRHRHCCAEFCISTSLARSGLLPPNPSLLTPSSPGLQQNLAPLVPVSLLGFSCTAILHSASPLKKVRERGVTPPNREVNVWN